MSLYVGKDTNGDNILHLTNGQVALSSMQSSTPLASTVFHNNMNLLTYDIYPITLGSMVKVPYPDYSVNGSSVYWPFSSTGLSLLDSSVAYYFTDANMNILSEAALKWGLGYVPSNGIAYLHSSRDANYKYPTIEWKVSNTGAYANIIIFTRRLAVTTKGGVYIGKGDIIVGDLDFKTLKYATEGSLINGNTNLFPFIANTYQLIDCSKVTGGMSIRTTAARIDILKGTEVILNSDSSFYYDSTITIATSINKTSDTVISNTPIIPCSVNITVDGQSKFVIIKTGASIKMISLSGVYYDSQLGRQVYYYLEVYINFTATNVYSHVAYRNISQGLLSTTLEYNPIVYI